MDFTRMTMSERPTLISAAVLGLLAVILGAFGSHGLKLHVSLAELEIWRTAVLYQMVHALALLATAFLPDSRWIRISRWGFLFGALFFSGSLYLLSLRSILPVPGGILGPVTPMGGLMFCAGWIGLLGHALRRSDT